MNTFKIKEIMKDGWGMTKKNWKFLVIMMLVYFGVSILLGGGANRHGFFTFLASLVSIAVRIIFTLGFIKISLNIISGITPKIDDFKTDWVTFGRAIWASIITAFFSILGLVLLIIPGIYVALRLQFSLYFVVQKKMAAWPAVKESWRLTKGSVLKLLGLGFLCVLIVLVSVIPFGLGLLISIPFVTITIALVYKKLSGQNVETVFQPDTLLTE